MVGIYIYMSPWIWYHNTSCVNQFPKWHGTTLFLKKQTAPQASFCHLTGHCLNDSFCLGPCTLESLLFGLYAGCSGCVSTNKKPIQTPDCFTACEKRRGMEESNFSTLHINCTIAQGLKQLQSISNLLDHWSAEAAVQILWGTNQTENPVSGRKKSFASTTCKERASASKAKRPRYPQSQARQRKEVPVHHEVQAKGLTIWAAQITSAMETIPSREVSMQLLPLVCDVPAGRISASAVASLETMPWRCFQQTSSGTTSPRASFGCEACEFFWGASGLQKMASSLMGLGGSRPASRQPLTTMTRRWPFDL